ncbi:hypothetical protein TNCV_934551 [Trichonephila clavipes]|nr:hypothetical protein TNCV_934551 [Trichonephila clavipes]
MAAEEDPPSAGGLVSNGQAAKHGRWINKIVMGNEQLHLIQGPKAPKGEAIYKRLQFIDIWILMDSSSSIQHFSHRTTVGDDTTLNILHLVVRLSSVYFQWVSSNIGLNVNEIADCLFKFATANTLQGNAYLTFTELSSIKRMELNALWRVLPVHP